MTRLLVTSRNKTVNSGIIDGKSVAIKRTFQPLGYEEFENVFRPNQSKPPEIKKNKYAKHSLSQWAFTAASIQFEILGFIC